MLAVVAVNSTQRGVFIENVCLSRGGRHGFRTKCQIAKLDQNYANSSRVRDLEQKV